MTTGKCPLNIPIIDLLVDCKNLLIAGMGGGFDVFCGLPIYLALRERGMNVHLANLSFSSIEYGNYHLTSKTKGSRLWISPLMPIYWFFGLEAVASRNLLIDYLQDTDTFQEAVRAVLAARQSLRIRSYTTLPLP